MTQTQEVRRLFAEKLSDADIATMLEIPRWRVARLRQRDGLLRRAPPAESVPDDDLREAYARLTVEHGRSPTADELAAETGLRRSSVLVRISRLRAGDGDLPLKRRQKIADPDRSIRMHSPLHTSHTSER